MANAAYAQTQNEPSALPVLSPGITIAVLQRTWHATPSGHRSQGPTLLECSILVLRNGATTAVKLRDLTLEEVERRIGAVTPKFVVRYYEQGKRGAQVKTFVERADAEKFASTRRLYAKPATVKSLAVSP